MGRILLLLLFPLMGFSQPFFDPPSGLTLEIPEEYRLDEEESMTDPSWGSWFYTFIDSKGNELVIEIDEYDEHTTLPEHFHQSVTVDADEIEEENWQLISEGLRFQNYTLEGREITQCQLRIIAIEKTFIEPLYISDFLFVNGKHGFSIGITAKDQEALSREEFDQILLNMLASIRFTGDNL